MVNGEEHSEPSFPTSPETIVYLSPLRPSDRFSFTKSKEVNPTSFYHIGCNIIKVHSNDIQRREKQVTLPIYTFLNFRIRKEIVCGILQDYPQLLFPLQVNIALWHVCATNL